MRSSGGIDGPESRATDQSTVNSIQGPSFGGRDLFRHFTHLHRNAVANDVSI